MMCPKNVPRIMFGHLCPVKLQEVAQPHEKTRRNVEKRSIFFGIARPKSGVSGRLSFTA
jgi:hypothetical protein